MKKLAFAIATASAIGLSLYGAWDTNAATQKKSQLPAAPFAETVQPEAVAALRKMSAYLTTLHSFGIKTNTTLDLVTANGQRVQMGGTAKYKVKRPDGFQIDVVTDGKDRRFFYDGKQFTMVAPKYKFYASAPAPSTIRETLDAIYDRYGIDLPLVDLFRWSDPNATPADNLTAAFHVGSATVDDVSTDHYAFREGDKDWEVWIEKGDKPLPRKLVIVSRDDPAHPAYIARINWDTNASFSAGDFTFKPQADDKAIHMAALRRP
jgi:hypothetical protein